ncbi:MAG TPA: hypothetical protein VK824_03520 [Planctomycetota bacterium]|nr:hypothetical protein [Planctomycetota bacterium]
MLIDIRTAILAARTAASDAISRRLAQTVARERLAAEQEKSSPDATRLTSLETDLRTAEGDSEKARKDFEGKLNAAVESVSVPGVLVMRWETRDKSSNGFSLGSLFGASTEDDLATSGFAILGGLRLTTLFVGPEIGRFRPGTKKSWDWGLHYKASGLIPWFLSRTYENARITTHIFQVQNVLYLQDADIEKKTAVALEASASQLQHLGTTLKKVEKVELESIGERLSSLSNLGVIGSVKRRVYPMDYRTGMFASLTGEDRSEIEAVTQWSTEGPSEIGAVTQQTKDGSSEMEAVTLQITGNTRAAQAVEIAKDKVADAAKLEEGAPDSSTGTRTGTDVQPQESWHTIYVVDTDLEALQDLFD